MIRFPRADDGSWLPEPEVIPVDLAGGADLRDPRVRLADMTGDGLLDIVRVSTDGVTFWPSLGAGRWEEPVRMEPAPQLPRDYDPVRLLICDVDGDGRCDLLYADAGRVLVWLNTGATSLSAVQRIDGTPDGRPQAADMAGDGTAGLVWNAPVTRPGRRGGFLYLRPIGSLKPYLLTQIDNGAGLRSTLSYRSSTEYALDDRDAARPWRTFHPFAVPCVASVQHTDAVGGTTAAAVYGYREARYDPVARTFVGFAQTTVDTSGGPQTPARRVVSTFHLGVDPADPERPLSDAERLTLGALRRRVLSAATYGLDGSASAAVPYHVVRHIYDTSTIALPGGASVVVPFVRQTVEETWERGSAPFAVRQIDYLDVDAHGNVHTQRSRIWRQGRQAQPDQDIIATTTFSAGGRNLISLPARVTQTDADGTPVSVTVTFYDGPDFEGLPEGQAHQGAVTRIEDFVLTAAAAAVYGTQAPDWASLGYHRLPDESGWWATRRSHGRQMHDGVTVLATRDSLGHESVMRTDATGQFPHTVTDAAGNTFTATADPQTSQLATLTDPNGNVSTDLFDALGRVRAIVGPGDTAAAPTVTYTYETAALPLKVQAERRDGVGGSAVSWGYFDGAGRPLASYAPGEGDAGRECLISNAQRFDGNGLLLEQALPYYSSSDAYASPDASVASVRMSYDALGRMVRLTRPDGVELIHAYTGGQLAISRVLTGAGPEVQEEQDVDGLARIITVRRFDGQRPVASSYEYDPQGHVTKVVDSDGSATVMTYDLTGRLLSHTRPDTGMTLFVYDAAGNQVQRRNAVGQTIETTVDAVGRVLAVRDPAVAAPEITYEYLDTGAPAPADGFRNRIGRLYRVTDRLGTITFAYDPQARPVESDRVVTELPGQHFVTSQAFDKLGRVRALTLPATTAGGTRQVFDYAYDARGQLSSIDGLVGKIRRDASGRVTSCTYANGTVNATTYLPGGGPLARLKVTGPGGQALLDQQMGYTPQGLPAMLTGLASADSVSFTYDGLQRLSAASYGDGGQEVLSYTDGGNVLSSPTLSGLAYSTGGAVSQASDGGYQTDAAGRLVSAPYGSLRFDGLDNLIAQTLSDGTQLTYDYDFRGQRVRTRRGGSTESLIITPQLEMQGATMTVWLTFGGARIAALANGTQVFLHNDPWGRAVLVTDATGAAVLTYRVGIYGISRGAAAGADGRLINLGRRWLDPALGRFISPDPIIAHGFTLDAWNPYVFAHNNPVAFADPSGCNVWDVLAVVGVAVAVAALVTVSVLTGVGVITTPFLVSLGWGTIAATAAGVAGGGRRRRDRRGAGWRLDSQGRAARRSGRRRRLTAWRARWRCG